MKSSRLCLALVLVVFTASLALAELQLPAALKELPRYPGATVVQTMNMDGNTNAIFQASASPAEVADFFTEKLPAQGWTKVMEARQDDGAMISFTKGSSSLTIGVGADDGGAVSYTVILGAQ